MTATASHDWMDNVLFWVQLVSLVGTVAAAALAAVTIRQASKQARASQEALLRERRLDFELDVLRDLIVAVQHNDAHNIRPLAMLLSVDSVPLTRAAVGLNTNADATDKVNDLQLPSGAHPSTFVERLRQEIQDELIAVIEERVNERG